MAFRLAEAFVELTLHDSALMAGLARVNRAVDDTHQRLSSLDELTGALGRPPAFTAKDAVDAASPRVVESRGRQTRESAFGLADAVAGRRSQEIASQTGQQDFTRPLAELADPLRDLSSSLGRLASDEGLSVTSETIPRTKPPLVSGADHFAHVSALLDELSRGAAAQESPDRTDRRSQQQLEALLRLDENVSRILQIQESRHAAGTAVFSPPA